MLTAVQPCIRLDKICCAADAQQKDTSIHFWKQVQTHFQQLESVFLQITTCSQSFAFNGQLTIDSPKDFTLCKGIALAALKGLNITASNIKNRGKLLTQGQACFKVKRSMDNRKGSLSATTALSLHCKEIKNDHGSIEVISGKILWSTGYQAVLSNDKGTIFAREGIERTNSHTKPPRPGLNPSSVSNRWGRIVAPEGPMEIFLDTIDNTHGLILGKVENILVTRFNNREGRLLIKEAGKIHISNTFENDLGFIESDAELYLSGGIWKNGAGSIKATLINFEGDKFSISNGGVIAALDGPVKMTTTHSLKQHGKIAGKGGIFLTSLEGNYDGRQGVLIAPNQLILITSEKHHVNVHAGHIQAQSCQINSVQQIDIGSTSFHLEKTLLVHSQVEWIDGQSTCFAKLGDQALFKAAKTIHLEGVTGQIGSLNIACKTLNLDNSALTIINNLEIQVHRYAGKNNQFDIHGDAVLKALRSIRSNDSEIKVSKGCYVQKSDEWIIETHDNISANLVRRDGKSLFVVRSREEVRQSANHGRERIVMQGYFVDAAEKLSFDSNGTALLHNCQWDAASIDISADALWMAEIESCFENRMKLLAESLAAVQNLQSVGKKLKVRVEKGNFNLNDSHLKHNASGIVVKGKTRIAKNILQGDTSILSEKSQIYSKNIFRQGEQQLSSSKGDIFLSSNQIHEGEDFSAKAKRGKVAISDTIADINKVLVDAKKVSMRATKVRSKRHIHIKAKDSVTGSDALLSSEEHIDLEAGKQLNLRQITLQSSEGTHLFADGIALIAHCKLLGKTLVNTQSAAVDESQFLAPDSEIELHIEENLFAQGTTFQSDKILLKHRTAVLINDQILGKSVAAFEGSTYAMQSQVQSDGEITGMGKELALEQTGMCVPLGKLSLTFQKTIYEKSFLQAETILENGESIISRNSQTVAADEHERVVNSIALLQGKDEASSLIEKSLKSSHVNHHFHAKQSIKVRSRKLLSHSSSYGANNIAVKAETILGAQDTFKGDNLNFNATTLFLSNSSLQAPAKVHANAHLTLRHSHLGAGILCVSKTGDVDLANSTLEGRNDIEAGGSIFAPQAHIKNESHWNAGTFILANHMRLKTQASSSLKAEAFIALNESDLQAKHLKLSGYSITRDGSQVSADKLYEIARRDISAERSLTNAASTVVQICGGTLAIASSTTHAGTSLHRNASEAIDHRYANTIASSQVIESSLLDARGATLQFVSGSSYYDLGLFKNYDATKLYGNGNIKFKIRQPHSVQGIVHMGGHFGIEAPSISFDTSVRALGVHAVATTGEMWFNFPLQASMGTFSAVGKMVNRSALQFDRRADFSAYQLWNRGSIESKENLSVHQSVYQDVGNVHAENHLCLSSDSSIHQTKMMHVPGSLSFISHGSFTSDAPLYAQNDLILAGTHITVNAPIRADNTGQLFTLGLLHFNNNTVHFSRGCAVTASTIFVDGSTIFCGGPMWLTGENFLIHNRSHLQQERKKVGKVAKKFCGIKYGSTTVWETVSTLIYDAIAKVEIDGPLVLNMQGKLSLDGILLARQILGAVGELAVGEFSHAGRIPNGMPVGHQFCYDGSFQFRPGGDLRAREGLDLEIMRTGHNRGFIDGGTYTKLKAVKIINEKGHSEGYRDAIAKKWLGHSRKKVLVDAVRPGGEIGGGQLELHAKEVSNLGGAIIGRDATVITGINFSNQALELRNVVQFSSGGFSHRATLVPAQVLSGGTLMSIHQGQWKNYGSEFVGWDDTYVKAGSIEGRSIFRPYVSRKSSGLTHSTTIRAIDKLEPSLRSVCGHLCVVATESDVDWEGKMGSYGGGDVVVMAKRDILFKARTESVGNKKSKWSLEPFGFSHTEVEYNTTNSTLPQLFSGGNVGLQAGNRIYGEGLQVISKGNFTKQARKGEFRSHKVQKYHSQDGFSVGISFFGSESVKALLAGKPGKAATSLLKEDRAIALCFEAKCKDVADVAVKGLKAVAQLWNEAAELTKAYNDGKLMDGIGRQVGLLDENGQFNPTITLRLGTTNSDIEWTENMPTYIHCGSISWHEDEQDYENTILDVQGGGDIVAKKLKFSVVADKYAHESSQWGMSLRFAPEGISVGLDFAEQGAKGHFYRNNRGFFGGHVNIHTDSLIMQGVSLDVDSCHVLAKEAHIQSLADTFSSKQLGGSISSSGLMAFSNAKSNTAEVACVAGLSARSHGMFTADSVHLAGAALNHIILEAHTLTHSDVTTFNKSHSFGFDISLAAVFKAMQHNAPGLTYLGSFDWKREKQMGRVQATLANGNGERYNTINTDNNLIYVQDKKRRNHVGTAMIAIHPEALRNEWQAMTQPASHANNESQDIVSGKKRTLTAKSNEKPEKNRSDSERRSLTSTFKKDQKPSQHRAKKAAKMPAQQNEHKVPVNSVEMQVLQAALPGYDENNLFETGAEKVKGKELTEDVSIGPDNAWEREIWFDMMAINDGINTIGSTVGEIASYPYAKTAQWYCQSSKQAEVNCRIAGVAYKKAIDYAIENIPDKIVNWWHERQKAIVRRSESNEKHLGIPKDMTLKFFRDGEANIMNFSEMLLFAGGGRLLSATRAIPRTKPAIEIITPNSGDLRGLHAKNVTPSTDLVKAANVMPARTAMLPAVGTSKAGPLSTRSTSASHRSFASSNALALLGTAATPSLPRSYYPLAWGEETLKNQAFKQVKEVVQQATAIPKGISTVPQHIDIESVMKAKIIPHYGSGSAQERRAVADFIQSYFGSQPNRIIGPEEHSLRGFTRNNLYLVNNDKGVPIAIAKIFAETKMVERGFIPDVISLDLLNKANLQQSSVPKILKVGKYTVPNEGEKGMVLYDFLPGESIETLIKKGVTDIPAEQMGRAAAEIHGLGPSRLVSRPELEKKIEAFKSVANGGLTKLFSLGYAAPYTSTNIEKIAVDLLRNPGATGWVHGDFHAGNVLALPERKVGIIDTASLLDSLNRTGVPHGLPALDKYWMTNSLRILGAKYGRSTEQTERLIAEFLQGYASLQPKGMTEEGEKFAESFSDIFLLNLLTTRKEHPELLNSMLERVKAHFPTSSALSHSGKLPAKAFEELPETKVTFRKITHISEFNKDLKKLNKKFRSLEEDINNFVTTQLYPFHKLGIENGGLFRIANLGFESPSVYKAKKVACRALKNLGSRNGIRIIYTYLPQQDEVLFLEIYHKSDKENEDRERIKALSQSINKK